ncbi:MAG: hypothetical protein IJD80_08170 [Oscillospiraceae bacterium]|nr:hypothetical protein [Oscillospiraceae bacterium]
MKNEIIYSRLSSEERSVMKNLKKGTPYIVIPFGWIGASVFVDMLTGMPGSLKSLVLNVVDAGFVLSGLWLVITGCFININGRKLYSEITADVPQWQRINSLALNISRGYAALTAGTALILLLKFILPKTITAVYFNSGFTLPQISYIFMGLRNITVNGKLTDIAEKIHK